MNVFAVVLVSKGVRIMADRFDNEKKLELRTITDEELQKILEGHGKWVESKGKEGIRADLNTTDLRNRKGLLIKVCLKNAILRGADLQGSNLFMADLREAELQNACLYDSKVQGADFYLADLRGADLRGADFSNAHVRDVKYDPDAKYRGIRVDSCYGSAFFKRFAQDQSWIEEYRATRETGLQKIRDLLWRVTSDYGRSMKRWAFVAFLITTIFGCLFYFFLHDSLKVDNLPNYPDPKGFISMIYYSVVTFTTLGFGDITPKTIYAACWVMLEVILGYIMLGGLISIFADKLARRS